MAKRNDVLRSIDIKNSEHRQKALKLALGASNCELYGEASAHALAAMTEKTMRPDEKLWTVWTKVQVDAADPSVRTADVVAITGNGEWSKANAEFFVDARAIVLGYEDQLDSVETELRNVKAKLQELLTLVASRAPSGVC